MPDDRKSPRIKDRFDGVLHNPQSRFMYVVFEKSAMGHAFAPCRATW
jgi:hypothetical protein